jgi:hypothetical protein
MLVKGDKICFMSDNLTIANHVSVRRLNIIHILKSIILLWNYINLHYILGISRC